jgi:hypothetical protein
MADNDEKSWRMGDPSIPPLQAATAMRALGWEERDALIEAGKPTVVDARHRFLTCSVTPFPSPGGNHHSR